MKRIISYFLAYSFFFAFLFSEIIKNWQRRKRQTEFKFTFINSTKLVFKESSKSNQMQIVIWLISQAEKYFVLYLFANINMNQKEIIYFPLQCVNFSYPWVPVIVPDHQILFSAAAGVFQGVQMKNFQVYGQQNILNIGINEGNNMIIGNSSQITPTETLQIEKQRNINRILKNQRRSHLADDNSMEIRRKQPETMRVSLQSQQKISFMNLNQAGKTSWTEAEQEKLKEMVNLFGKRWKYISEHFPNRTGKQIRQRYLNYLKPNLSKNKWTEEEDNEILNLVGKYGRSWRTLEKKLKNRSQNQIKNRYYGHLHKNEKSKVSSGNDAKTQKFQISSAKTSTHLGAVEDTAK